MAFLTNQTIIWCIYDNDHHRIIIDANKRISYEIIQLWKIYHYHSSNLLNLSTVFRYLTTMPAPHDYHLNISDDTLIEHLATILRLAKELSYTHFQNYNITECIYNRLYENSHTIEIISDKY